MDVARRLVLHLDVNETIMACDPAGGDTFENCLNKIIAKNVFIKPRVPPPPTATSHGKHSEWVFCDGSPIDKAYRDPSTPPPPLLSDGEFNPPEGCCSIYKSPLKTKELAGRFTEPGQVGEIYRDVFFAMEKALQAPPGTDPRLLLYGGPHYLVFPSVFGLLRQLTEAGRPHTLVIRTFGTDLSDVADAFTAFAEGKHPAFPGVGPAYLFPRAAQFLGRYKEDGQYTVTPAVPPRAADDACDAAAAGAGAGAGAMDEAEAVKMIESGQQILGVGDHYTWWRDHEFRPESGKPLWLTLDDAGTHHIFFDDNIHNAVDDSIVSVRVRQTAPDKYVPASGAATVALQGIVLVRCPTFEPILNPGWFMAKIEECERNRAAKFATPGQINAVLAL